MGGFQNAVLFEMGGGKGKVGEQRGREKREGKGGDTSNATKYKPIPSKYQPTPSVNTKPPLFVFESCKEKLPYPEP